MKIVELTFFVCRRIHAVAWEPPYFVVQQSVKALFATLTCDEQMIELTFLSIPDNWSTSGASVATAGKALEVVTPTSKDCDTALRSFWVAHGSLHTFTGTFNSEPEAGCFCICSSADTYSICCSSTEVPDLGACCSNGPVAPKQFSLLSIVVIISG